VCTLALMIDESDLEQHRGQWVAFDESTGKVRASADSAELLYETIDRDELGRVTIMRVPRLDDPLFIGLG